nr:hypothetical protein [Mycobacteroides abscessus]
MTSTQIRQIAELLLPSTAEVIEIQLASLATATHHDQAALTASAPHETFKEVVVAALPVARSWHDFQY